MKAAVLHAYGGPEELKYEEFPDPVPGPGEVLIRVAAASINPVDTYFRSGARKDSEPLRFPVILGWDVAGKVESLGAGAAGFAVGDEVFAWADHAYAELCPVPADLLAKVPAGLKLDEAAAIPLVGLTGTQLVQSAQLRPGQTVLVSGAAGAVGRFAVFAATQAGARVIAGVSRAKQTAAEALNVKQVLLLDDEDALRRTPLVDVVANTLRGATADRLLRLVKPGGVFASVSGVPPSAKEHPEIRAWMVRSKQDPQGLPRLAQAVVQGKATLAIGLRLPLSLAARGHAAVERGGAGKVVLVP
jgi:NADPH:quinone reductase-like Zn-dependent oxidoreductase